MKSNSSHVSDLEAIDVKCIFNFSYRIHTRPNSPEVIDQDNNFVGPDIEVIPESLRNSEAMVIQDLKKTFKSVGKEPVNAVKGISLKIFPGEITAILGHNGAGKTTLFNMLTGMTTPSSGTAYICG